MCTDNLRENKTVCIKLTIGPPEICTKPMRYYSLRSRVSSVRVNSQRLSLSEPSIFDPPQSQRPLTDRQKFVTGDYVQDFYSCAKFGGNPSMGSVWTNM